MLQSPRAPFGPTKLSHGETEHSAFQAAKRQPSLSLLNSASIFGAALRAAPVVARIRDASLRPEYTRLLAGWIGLAGPYDFLPIGDAKTQVAFNWPDTSADTQPLAYASKASPPALLLAPVNDSVVSPQRSTVAMAQRLKASGVRVESALFDGVSHVTLLASMAQVLRGRAPVLERVSGFVQSAG